MNKNISYIFHNKFIIILFSFLLLILFTILRINQSNILIVNHNKQYLVRYTYYFPGDATGSGGCTGSGKCINDFTVDENGWYHYEANGKSYLVVAAALKVCRDSSNHCGINVNEHGIAKSIKYYDYYDTLTLTIDGKSYDAMVLDACGACMWGRQDDRGDELFDIFVVNSASKVPGSGPNDGVNYNGRFETELEHFGTTYTGDIKQGWIYQRFDYEEIYNVAVAEYKIESNINNGIDEIFNRAKTVYKSYLDSGIGDISGLIGDIDAGPYSSWLQCNSQWGSIRLGSSNYTICSAGCAATSVAIQIARSGAQLSSALNGNLNPGSFVALLNQNGGFTSGGAIYWGKASIAAPNFQFANSVGLFGTPSSKLNTIASYLSSGNNYIVAHVNGSKNGTTSNHWVAITGVTSTDVAMIDPSGRGNSLDSAYGLEYLDDIRVYTVN